MIDFVLMFHVDEETIIQILKSLSIARNNENNK